MLSWPFARAMTQAFSRHHHTLADYLAVEEVSIVRHELIGGEIVALAGGTPEHAALASAISGLLTPQLKGKPCRPYSADLRLRVLATGLATYADASVVCEPLERDPSSPTHVTNPRVVFEVLSPGTESYDRGEKREHYQQLPSLREYVLVSQSSKRVEVWSRTTEQEAWRYSVYGAGEAATLASIQCDLMVDDLYAAAGVG